MNEALSPEVIHSLAIEGSTLVAPGELRRLTFHFANRGFAVLSLSARLVDGAQAIELKQAAATIDDAGGPQHHLLDIHGGIANLPPLAPTGTMSMEFVIRLRDALEDLSEIPLQLELDDGSDIIGSNIVRLRVRSSPDLSKSSASLALTDGVPAAIITMRNGGASTAHDVTIGVRSPGAGRQDIAPFDLPAGATREIRVSLDGNHLMRGLLRLPPVTVEALEVAAFQLSEEQVLIGRPRLVLDLRAPATATPGETLTFELALENAGSAPTGPIAIAAAFPAELRFNEESVRLNDSFVTLRKRQRKGGIDIPARSLEAGERVIVRWSMQSSISAANETVGTVAVDVSCESDSAHADVKTEFAARPLCSDASRLYVDRAFAAAGETLRAMAIVINGGTAAAQEVTLAVTGERIRSIRGFEVAGANRWIRSIGKIGPASSREVPFEITLAEVVAHGEHIELTAAAQFDGAPFETIATSNITVESQPRFDHASSIVTLERDTISSGETIELTASVANVGSDVAEAVTIKIATPSFLSLDSDTILIGDIAPGESRAASCSIHLSAPLPEDTDATIVPIIGADNHRPLRLEPVVLRTRADAGVVAELATSARDAENLAKVGDIVTMTLTLENTGDGNAHHLVVRTEPLEGTLYVPASMQVNGHAITERDFQSPMVTTGLAFELVPPRAVIVLQWQLKLLPVAAAQYLTPYARISWDNGKAVLVTSEPVSVTASSAIGTGTNDVTFTLLRGGKPNGPVSPANRQPEHTSATASRASTAPPRPAAEVQLVRGETMARVGSETAGAAMPPSAPAPPNEVLAGPVAPVPAQATPLTPPAEATPLTPEATADEAPPTQDPREDAPASAEAEAASPAPQSDFRYSDIDGPELVGSAGENAALLESSEGDLKVPAPAELAALPDPRTLLLERELDGDYLPKTERFLKSCGGRGLLSHIIALSRLLPSKATGCDGLIVTAYDEVIFTTRYASEQLFIRSSLAGFSAAANDLETRPMRGAITRFVDAINQRLRETVCEADLPLYATLPFGELADLRALLDTEPIGSVAVYQLLVSLIPNRGTDELAVLFGRYRDLFQDALTGGQDAKLEELIAEVETSALDSALRDVLSALQSRLKKAAA